MLKTRLITGAIFVLVVYFLITYDSVTATALLVIITAACSFEYTNIARKGIKDPSFNLSFVCGVAPIILALIKGDILEGQEIYVLLISFVVMMLFSFASLVMNIRNNHHILAPLINLFYIGLPMACISRLLVQGEFYQESILLGIMLYMWVTDSGAYVVGRALGKNPLHKRVSPKKTIEGSLGAGLFAAIAAYVFSLIFTELNLTQWLIMAGLSWIFGTWGDLYESSIKRQFQIKDSGTILPGHGGFLDRFDSFIFAAPAVVLTLFLLYDF